jgi:hypothetical protein
VTCIFVDDVFADAALPRIHQMEGKEFAMLYFSIIHDEFGSKSSIQVIHLKEDSG